MIPILISLKYNYSIICFIKPGISETFLHIDCFPYGIISNFLKILKWFPYKLRGTGSKEWLIRRLNLNHLYGAGGKKIGAGSRGQKKKDKVTF